MDLSGIFTESPVLSGIFLASCLYLLTQAFGRSAKSPFSANYVRPPPRVLVTDQKDRDKVLKQSKFQSDQN